MLYQFGRQITTLTIKNRTNLAPHKDLSAGVAIKRLGQRSKVSFIRSLSIIITAACDYRFNFGLACLLVLYSSI